LNKQYTKDERETHALNIVKELQEQQKRWEFFDPEFSPFPYNDTVADEYYPIKSVRIDGKETIINPQGEWSVTVLDSSKFIADAILDLWWKEKIKIKRRTKENEINIPVWIQTIKHSELMSDTNQVGDDIVDKAIICKVTGRLFKISAPELHFYRKNNFPIPHKHPDIRHQDRLHKRPGRDIWLRTCDKCWKKMLSIYDQNSKFKVYCESCYKQEIYG
jgi:hypothetical protein